MNKMPALFVSHGAPTYALDPGLAGAQLRQLGQILGKPRAVVIVSPHWMTRGIAITATGSPQTIHDFGGFPQPLYSVQYPAPGDPQLAWQIQQILADQGWASELDPQRGLDHGAWVPLLHLYPDADVPTVQVSLPLDTDEASALALGRALAPLAQQGVLIIGSGSLTHNLYEVRLDNPNAQAAAYAAEFVAWVRQAVVAGDVARVQQTLKIAPHAHRAHPTTEHFLPLLVAVGAGSTQAVTVLDGGIQHSVLAMESYVLGAASLVHPH
jgi:4,5-DOPA dioxygenase extradiol